MLTIHKYKITGTGPIEMPVQQKILTAQFQKDALYIWAMVETDNPKEKVMFELVGTGHEVLPNSKRLYIATAQEGSYVWHLFQILK